MGVPGTAQEQSRRRREEFEAKLRSGAEQVYAEDMEATEAKWMAAPAETRYKVLCCCARWTPLLGVAHGVGCRGVS